MKRRTFKFLGFAAVLAAALLASPALAQLKGGGTGKTLNEAEAKAALLGIDMQGFSPTYRMQWRECIQPNGETLYETPAGVMKGRLIISPSGEACFSYEDDGYASISCFVTYQKGATLHFEGLDSLFVTTRIVTGVKSCTPRNLVG